jgi:hypothetical protein
MAKSHPGTRISHDILDLFPHRGLIAMNHTLGAGGLCVAKRAFVESQKRVALQIRAFITNPPRLIVIVLAVDLDHRANGLPFTLEPREPGARHNTSSFLMNESIP